MRTYYVRSYTLLVSVLDFNYANQSTSKILSFSVSFSLVSCTRSPVISTQLEFFMRLLFSFFFFFLLGQKTVLYDLA